jgi:hypothetical protein
VATSDPGTGAAITIIGHPNAAPKQIEAGTVASFSTNYLRYGNVDTLGGSSGSGVLNSLGQIVGVHTNGGCTALKPLWGAGPDLPRAHMLAPDPEADQAAWNAAQDRIAVEQPDHERRLADRLARLKQPTDDAILRSLLTRLDRPRREQATLLDAFEQRVDIVAAR